MTENNKAEPKKIKTSVLKAEEIKSVNERVLAFGVSAVLVILLLICGALVFLFYTTTVELGKERTKIIELQQNKYDLRRALDRLEGRVQVYEGFLIGTQTAAFQRLIAKFLREGRIHSSADAPLSDFENWMYHRDPPATGLTSFP